MIKVPFLTLSLAVAGTTQAQMLSPVTIGNSGLVLKSNSGGLSFTAIHLFMPTSQLPADSMVMQSLEVYDGITGGNKNGSFAVYPNPAIDNLWFAFQLPDQGTVAISLYNNFGQKIKDVYSGSYDTKKITEQLDISKLPAGNYLLNLKFTNSKNETFQLNRKFQIIF